MIIRDVSKKNGSEKETVDKTIIKNYYDNINNNNFANNNNESNILLITEHLLSVLVSMEKLILWWIKLFQVRLMFQIEKNRPDLPIKILIMIVKKKYLQLMNVKTVFL